MSEKPVLIYPEGSHSSTCGYCSPSGQRSAQKSSFSVGISPVQLSCSFYQKMLDRGWRRSGEYCYKPDLHRSCCPQYTIRLDVDSFTPTRSQRKVVNRWNRFVLNGSDEDVEMDGKPKSTKGATRKPSTFDLVPTIHASEASFNYGQTPVQRFEVTIEPSSFTEEKFQLYAKYQAAVHNDHKEDKDGFTRFLVDSPLEYSPIPYTTEHPAHVPANYGSYHQLYRLNGDLIALAVIDILPNCVSSVYFMYDTAWEKFSLGKLSAMREAALAKEIKEYGPQDLKYLYMGFYIHSCPKMRYKGDYSPSYLLDPEEYSWHSLQLTLPLMDKYSYVSFANPQRSREEPAVDAVDRESTMKEVDVSGIYAWQGQDGLQPLAVSKYWKQPLLRTALLQAIEGLGKELSRDAIFVF